MSGTTLLYGVLGAPIAHTRSPAMHNAAFAHHGLDAVYVALPVEPDGLADAIRGAHALGFRGVNVTVPHKQAVARLVAPLDPVASETGAVNTLVRRADGWEGHNMDAPACLELLEAAGVRAGARALLAGAGGVARAAAWALKRLGAEVVVAARREVQGAELAQEVGAAAVSFARLAEESERADVIVNATPIGLAPAGIGGARLDLRFRAGQVALDAVYGDTAFVREARAAGARVVTGEALLVRQGALAFNLWTGRAAPEAEMLAAVERARDPSTGSGQGDAR
ncbi:MAG TPA: shikimate dehydrogenase [Anaeromyxobacteraceae bacterium]|nr:shikimate dehydrogenase [Anaeromyxobacteraceae bacterium]